MDSALEHAVAVLVGRRLVQDKGDAQLRLLSPFQEVRLEVHFLLRHLVERRVAVYHAFLHEASAASVALIQVDGADERLEGVAEDVTVMRLWAHGGDHHLVQPHLEGDAVKRIALHDLRPCAGQEALLLVGEVFVEDVGHGDAQDSVAQEFQPLVVAGVLARGRVVRRAVGEGLLIEPHVVRIKSQHAIHR